MIKNFKLVLIIVVILSNYVAAQSTWEVATIYLGSNENETYQKDIDQNILELARLDPGKSLSLSIYRELPKYSVQYYLNTSSKNTSNWDHLFFHPPIKGIKIPGIVSIMMKQEQSILQNVENLRNFFKQSFKNAQSKKILIIYGHGFGNEGLKNIPLKDLRNVLEKTLPKRNHQKPLDILWLDACFMANLEVVFELRNLSSLYLASEDAEFSAGVPFDSLELLKTAPMQLLPVATELATRFVESYSYLKQGSQRKSVFSSAATISVIDTKNLDHFVNLIIDLTKELKGKLSPSIRVSLQRSFANRKMETTDLVDFAKFLLALKKQEPLTNSIKEKIQLILNLIEFNPQDRKLTTQRITLKPKEQNSYAVYGFQNWSLGYENDVDTLNKLPKSLKPEFFTLGPNNNKWPTRSIKHRLVVTPFAPGLNNFQVYFLKDLNSSSKSEIEHYVRLNDLYTFRAQTPENPIQFLGYTQGIGANAERYFGLSILDPSLGSTSLKYLDTEFAKITSWGNL